MFLECGSDAQGLDAFIRVSRDLTAFNRPAPVVLEVVLYGTSIKVYDCSVTSLTPSSNRVPSSAPTILHSLRIISLSNSLQSVKTELFDLIRRSRDVIIPSSDQIS